MMPGVELDGGAHLPEWPARRDVGIGVVGAGFIVRDCHLVAYAQAGFRGRGNHLADARACAARSPGCGRFPASSPSVEEMLDDPVDRGRRHRRSARRSSRA